MNKQRGLIAQAYLYMAGALAIIAGLTALVLAWNAYTARLDKQGYARGVSETTSAFEKRDNAVLQAVMAEKQAAEDKVRTSEAQAAGATEAAIYNYDRGVKDGQEKTDGLVAAARAGALRLRDPGKTRASAPCGVTPTVPETSTATSGTDGQNGGGGLSTEATGFLLSEGERANTAVKKLNLCRDELLIDRKLCNGE